MIAYLFLGQDRDNKKIKIDEIKNKHLKSQDALKLDLEVLYAHKLDSDDLKKALIALPAVSKERVILVYESHKLSAHNKELVLEFLETEQKTTVLILESDSATAKDSFVKKVTPFVKVVGALDGYELNVFDITRAIDIRKPQEALKVLSQLLASGTHPLQIMGGVIWFWGKTRNRLEDTRFKEGLDAIEEADLNIKRSRLKAEHAVELLVVKLCALR